MRIVLLVPGTGAVRRRRRLRREAVGRHRSDAGSDPTFSSIQREIFDTTDSSGRAACIQCHITGGAAAGTGLLLTADVSYGNLVNRPSRLQPGQHPGRFPAIPTTAISCASSRAARTSPGMRMPRTAGPFLTDGQMSVIRRWIEEGAANN